KLSEQPSTESQVITPKPTDRKPEPVRPNERRQEPSKPQGTQVRILSPRPGVKVTPAPPAPKPTVTPIKTDYRKPSDSREVRGRAQTGNFSIGSVAKGPAPEPSAHKPLTVYVPQDTGRPKGRNTRKNKRGGPGDFAQKHEEGKQFGQHRDRFTAAQPKLKPVFTELRPVKLIEGATVKDFSEKLEIKPK